MPLSQHNKNHSLAVAQDNKQIYYLVTYHLSILLMWWASVYTALNAAILCVSFHVHNSSSNIFCDNVENCVSSNAIWFCMSYDLTENENFHNIKFPRHWTTDMNSYFITVCWTLDLDSILYITYIKTSICGGQALKNRQTWSQMLKTTSEYEQCRISELLTTSKFCNNEKGYPSIIFCICVHTPTSK